MAYLGQVMFVRRRRQVLWTLLTVPEEMIGDIVGQFATYGGYIYVG